MRKTFYHELTHAAHYVALGESWYRTFVGVEETEIINNLSSGYLPYGDGSNSSSPIIALDEGWAYHIGHFLANQRYTTTASPQSEQVDIMKVAKCLW